MVEVMGLVKNIGKILMGILQICLANSLLFSIPVLELDGTSAFLVLCGIIILLIAGVIQGGAGYSGLKKTEDD